MPRNSLHKRKLRRVTGTPFQILQVILEGQLAAAPEAKVGTIAATIYESEPDALAPFVRDHTIRWLCMLLRKKRAASRPEQLPLPGFEHIPPIIKNDRGDQKLLDATAIDLRQYRAKIFTTKWRNSRRVQELQSLIGLLKGKKQGTTVGDILGLTKPKLPD